MEANNSYLALNASLAAATVAGVAVQPAVAATLFPGEADGSELGLLPRVDAGDARGSEEGSTALRGQRLEEEIVVHLHSIHIEVLVRHVLQSQQVSLSALHCAVPRQLRRTRGFTEGQIHTHRSFDKVGVSFSLFPLKQSHNMLYVFTTLYFGFCCKHCSVRR